MKICQMLRGAAVALATCGLLIPAGVVEAAQGTTMTQPTDVVRDVALQDGGVLQGQVVDAQGAAQAGVAVAVDARGQNVATVQTDAQGYFRVAGLRGGMHVVRTGDYVATHRLWAPHTAPPVATGGLLIVNSQDAQRGNIPGLVSTYGVGALLVGGLITTIVVVAVQDDAS